MKVYKSKIVQEVESFYGDLLYNFDSHPTVHKYLKAHVKKLWKGIKKNNPVVEYEIKNYHPSYIEGNGDVFFQNNLTRKVARMTIAREYGFSRWKRVVEHGSRKIDPEFEKAVEHVLNGEIEALKDMLDADPKLISKQSKFGHGATLLHYTASNGVELWRQRVPVNLPEITRCLLDHGADKGAKMNAYGSEFDTLALLESSAHPFDAGVGEKMLEILSR